MWRIQRDTSKVLAKATRRMELVFINNEKMGRAGADEREWTQRTGFGTPKFMRPIKSKRRRQV